MNSGELIESVELLKPVERRDSYGGTDTTYQHYTCVRMKVVSEVGDKMDENHEIVQSYDTTFFCYYFLKSHITEKFILKWGGYRYRILSISGNRRRNELTIKTERIND